MLKEQELITQDRHSRVAIKTDTDHSFFVEAGAGSGKTTELIGRLLTLLIEKDVRIENIAAITFNTQAAKELTSRLRRDLNTIKEHGRLESEHAFLERDFETVGPEEASRRAKRALRGLPGAAIETLHSFSLRLLKQFPLEAGLPPKVEKVDDLKAEFDLVQRQESAVGLIMRVFEGDLSAAEELLSLNAGVTPEQLTTAVTVLLNLNVDFSKLHEVCEWMDRNWGELPRVTEAKIIEAGDLSDSYFRSIAQRVRELGAGAGALQKFTDKQALELEEVLDSDNPIYYWQPKEFKAGNLGGKAHKAEREEALTLLREAKDKVAQVPLSALTIIRRVLLAQVLCKAQQRCSTGIIEYGDMIFLARQLLLDDANDHVRQQLHEQFSTIFVDEFQDTSPAQLSIVEALARGTHESPVPGHLFFVGDPKQSIYMFNGADVDTYMAARKKAEANNEVIAMQKNFRSSYNVTRAVNDLFGSMFYSMESGDGMQAPMQIGYSPMIPKDDGDKNPGKVVFLSDPEALSEKTVDRSDLENRDIVELIKSALSTKTLDSAKEFFGTDTPFTLNDIAILVPTHSIADRVIQGLDNAHIPYVSEKSGSLFFSPEISDLLQVLRSIGDPANSLLQLAALRSMAIGCSDEEIAQHRVLVLTESNELETHKVEKMRLWLREKAHQAQRTTLGSFIETVIAELHLREAVAAKAGEVGLERLNYVLEKATEFGVATGLGLRSFVSWADRQAESNNGHTDPLVDNGKAGVRVMTIHASKGREFPFVIMAGLSNSFGTHKDSVGYTRKSPRAVEFALSGCGTDRAEEVLDFLAKATVNEYVRLDYVAATRAKTVLAVPFEPRMKKDGSPYSTSRGKLLWDAIEDLTDANGHGPYEFIHRSELIVSDDLDMSTSQPEFSTETADVAAQRITEELDKVHQAAAVAPRVSVTRIAHAEAKPADEDLDYAAQSTGIRLHQVLQEELAASRPAKPAVGIKGNVRLKTHGAAFGSAVHEVLELLPAADVPVEDLAATIAPLHDLTEESVEDIATAARSLVDSDPYRASLATDKVYRELPLITTIDGTAVDGVIDLLYFDDARDEWVVADYKTDKSAKAATVESYFLQLELYARVVETTLKHRVGRLELIFVTPGPAHVVTRQR